MSLPSHTPLWEPATHPCGERRSTFLTGRGTRCKRPALESLQYRLQTLCLASASCLPRCVKGSVLVPEKALLTGGHVDLALGRGRLSGLHPSPVPLPPLGPSEMCCR